MFRILYNSRSGMMAQQEKIDSIAANLANSGTTGYKKTDVSFSDLVYETLNRKGYPVTDGENPFNGTGVKANDITRVNTQGDLTSSDRSTDFALDGDGYFQVQLRDGTYGYTRAGSFNIDTDGSLVDKNGDRLVIDYTNGPVPISANLTVKEDGNVSMIDDNGNTVNVGKINIFDVDKNTGNTAYADSLTSVGNSIYKPKDGITMRQVTGTNIEQRKLEVSNVNMGKELTDLIVSERAYQFNSQGLKTADEMMSMINNLRK